MPKIGRYFQFCLRFSYIGDTTNVLCSNSNKLNSTLKWLRSLDLVFVESELELKTTSITHVSLISITEKELFSVFAASAGVEVCKVTRNHRSNYIVQNFIAVVERHPTLTQISTYCLQINVGFASSKVQRSHLLPTQIQMIQVQF